MVRMSQIRAVCRRIGRQFGAERVVVFGSHARGEADEDSDVDVLAILPFDGRPADKAVEVMLKIRPPFPMDLLVRTPEAVRRRSAMGDCFIEEILKTGKVLYEAPGR